MLPYRCKGLASVSVRVWCTPKEGGGTSAPNILATCTLHLELLTLKRRHHWEVYGCTHGLPILSCTPTPSQGHYQVPYTYRAPNWPTLGPESLRNMCIMSSWVSKCINLAKKMGAPIFWCTPHPRRGTKKSPAPIAQQIWPLFVPAYLRKKQVMAICLNH